MVKTTEDQEKEDGLCRDYAQNSKSNNQLSREEEQLQQKYRTASLKARIRKEDETALKGKIIIASVAVGIFVIVSHLFFYVMFAKIGIDFSRFESDSWILQCVFDNGHYWDIERIFD